MYRWQLTMNITIRQIIHTTTSPILQNISDSPSVETRSYTYYQRLPPNTINKNWKQRSRCRDVHSVFNDITYDLQRQRCSFQMQYNLRQCICRETDTTHSCFRATGLADVSHWCGGGGAENPSTPPKLTFWNQLMQMRLEHFMDLFVVFVVFVFCFVYVYVVLIEFVFIYGLFSYFVVCFVSFYVVLFFRCISFYLFCWNVCKHVK